MDVEEVNSSSANRFEDLPYSTLFLLVPLFRPAVVKMVFFSISIFFDFAILKSIYTLKVYIKIRQAKLFVSTPKLIKPIK